METKNQNQKVENFSATKDVKKETIQAPIKDVKKENSDVSAEPAKEEKEQKPKKELSLKGTKIRNAFKQIYKVVSKFNKLDFRTATEMKIEEVPEVTVAGKILAKGSPEAAKRATENYYQTITSKIGRNETEEKNNAAIEILKQFISATTVKDSAGVKDEVATRDAQSKIGQSIMDEVMSVYKGERKGLPKKEVLSISLEDLF